MLPRHAAPSLPAGRRADGLTWMGRSSGRAARQLRLHRLSRPCRAQTRLPRPPAGGGPGAEHAGLPLQPGPRRDPRRPPARTQPWDGHFPTPTNRQDCHPVLQKANPAAERSAPEAPDTPLPLWLHSTAGLCRKVQGEDRSSSSTTTDTGGEQKAPATESSATSTGTQDIRLVATKSSLANRGEKPRHHLHPCRAIWDPKSAVTGIAGQKYREVTSRVSNRNMGNMCFTS